MSKAVIRIKLDAKKRRLFKAKCMRQAMSMQGALETFIDYYLTKDKDIEKFLAGFAWREDEYTTGHIRTRDGRDVFIEKGDGGSEG